MNVDKFRPWCFNIENFDAKLVCPMPQYLASVTKTDVKYWLKDYSIQMLCADFCSQFKSASAKMGTHPIGNYLTAPDENAHAPAPAQLPPDVITTYNKLYDLLDIIITRAIIGRDHKTTTKLLAAIISLNSVNNISFRFIFYVNMHCCLLLQTTVTTKFLLAMIDKLEQYKGDPRFLACLTVQEVDLYIATFKNMLATAEQE